MPDTRGRLLHHLPAVYHKPGTLCQLLTLFENFLFGQDQTETEKERSRQTGADSLPLADNIAAIASLFNARQTPREFLPWLSQWVALSDFGDLTEAQHRQLIARIVPLYALRGTKVYLERLLELFKPENFQIKVDDSSLQGFTIGTSKVGEGTVFLSDRPFWFRVIVTLSASEKNRADLNAFKAHWEQRLCRIIDLAKPVHTLYTFYWDDPT